MRSWRNLALRSSMLTACRITFAELRAEYGNLLLCIQAVSNLGTLFTNMMVRSLSQVTQRAQSAAIPVSKRPMNRILRTGREKVSRKDCK